MRTLGVRGADSAGGVPGEHRGSPSSPDPVSFGFVWRAACAGGFVWRALCVGFLRPPGRGGLAQDRADGRVVFQLARGFVWLWLMGER